VTVERDIRDGRFGSFVCLGRSATSMCVKRALVEDHRARMVGMVVAVDGMRDAGVGDRGDSPQDVLSDGGRGVYRHDSLCSCHEDHLVEAVS
jgi:hypothetical protein